MNVDPTQGITCSLYSAEPCVIVVGLSLKDADICKDPHRQDHHPRGKTDSKL